jgi:hypothetical protein
MTSNSSKHIQTLQQLYFELGLFIIVVLVFGYLAYTFTRSLVKVVYNYNTTLNQFAKKKTTSRRAGEGDSSMDYYLPDTEEEEARSLVGAVNTSFKMQNAAATDRLKPLTDLKKKHNVDSTFHSNISYKNLSSEFDNYDYSENDKTERDSKSFAGYLFSSTDSRLATLKDRMDDKKDEMISKEREKIIQEISKRYKLTPVS